MPACAKTCPTGAIAFGDRAEMVQLGKKRVAKLQTRGMKDASLYGDAFLGGTGRMFVLGAPPKEYRLPEDPKVSITISAWKKVVRPLGKIGVAATVLGLGVNWFINMRSRKVAAAKTAETPAKPENGHE
jgi:hypothetical protein